MCLHVLAYFLCYCDILGTLSLAKVNTLRGPEPSLQLQNLAKLNLPDKPILGQMNLSYGFTKSIFIGVFGHSVFT